MLRANVRDGSGIMRIELATGEGFLQALPDKITVLTDAALAANEVDVAATAKNSRRRRKSRRRPAATSSRGSRAQAKIDFAQAKLKVVGVS